MISQNSISNRAKNNYNISACVHGNVQHNASECIRVYNKRCECACVHRLKQLHIHTKHARDYDLCKVCAANSPVMCLEICVRSARSVCVCVESIVCCCCKYSLTHIHTRVIHYEAQRMMECEHEPLIRRTVDYTFFLNTHICTEMPDTHLYTEHHTSTADIRTNKTRRRQRSQQRRRHFIISCVLVLWRTGVCGRSGVNAGATASLALNYCQAHIEGGNVPAE